MADIDMGPLDGPNPLLNPNTEPPSATDEALMRARFDRDEARVKMMGDYTALRGWMKYVEIGTDGNYSGKALLTAAYQVQASMNLLIRSMAALDTAEKVVEALEEVQ